MSDKDVKTGLVGFFDILGYRNLLERNEPEAIAETVLPILTDIGTDITGELLKLSDILNAAAAHKNRAPEEVAAGFAERNHQIINSIGWLVFSDTVLLTMPFDESSDIELCWVSFMSATIMLHTRLFKAGLPARGAIDYGKYFVKNTCFAGRTNTVYTPGSYNFEFRATGNAVTKEAILAYEVDFVLFDLWGHHLTHLVSTQLVDLAAEQSLPWKAGWRARESDVSEYLTCATYVKSVLNSQKKIWRYDFKNIVSKLNSLQLRISESVMEQDERTPRKN